MWSRTAEIAAERRAPRAGAVAAAVLGAMLVTAAVGPPPAAAACGADSGTPTILTALATICWDCLFPISLFSVPIDPGSGEASTDPAIGPGMPFPVPNPYPPPVLCSCVCTNVLGVPVCLPGIPIGYWEPRHLVEVVHEPFCFPSLGIDLSDAVSDFLIRGDEQTGHDEASEHLNSHYAHVHFIVFPALKIFSLLMDVLCINATAVIGELDLMYLSELDPLWTADVLAALMFPETILFANPIAGAACVADSIAASFDMPIDALFWCAGGWGQIYPPAGRQNNTSGGNLAVQPLLWARVLAKLARTGLETWAAGNAEKLCEDIPTFMLVKSQYKWQLLDPVSYSADKCCLKIGASQALWEWGKTIPVKGEGHIWLLWRRQNCCMM